MYDQLSELEAAWAALPQEKAAPTRLVRSEQAKKQAAIAAGTDTPASSDSAAPQAEAAVDAYEFLEAVEVMSKVRARARDMGTRAQSRAGPRVVR